MLHSLKKGHFLRRLYLPGDPRDPANAAAMQRQRAHKAKLSATSSANSSPTASKPSSRRSSVIGEPVVTESASSSAPAAPPSENSMVGRSEMWFPTLLDITCDGNFVICAHSRDEKTRQPLQHRLFVCNINGRFVAVHCDWLNRACAQILAICCAW